MSSSQTLVPNIIVSSSGYDGVTVADLEADDGSFAEAQSAQNDTTLRVGFPTPTAPPMAGAALQRFDIIAKGTGGSDPSLYVDITVRVRDTGSGTDIASASGTILASFAESTFQCEWDAAGIYDSSGAGVECVVEVTHTQSGGSKASLDIEKVSWFETYPEDSAGDIAFTVPKPTVSMTAGFTDPPPSVSNADIAFTVPKPTVSAAATFVPAQYAADIAFTVPKPSIISRADFLPVTGNTGWLQPGMITNWTDTGYIVTNLLNMQADNDDTSNVQLFIFGGDASQTSRTLIWDWIDPANYPEAAYVTGVEFIVYADHWTQDGDAQAITIYDLFAGSLTLEDNNESNPVLDHDDGEDPFDAIPWNHAQHWGGESDIGDLAPNTLVSDFLAEEHGATGKHTALKIKNLGYSSGSTLAYISIAHVRMKIWWEEPAFKDMAATPSFGVTISDSLAPLQKIKDIGSDMSASMSATNTVIGVPITMYSDLNISMEITGPTISEGTTDIDMDCNLFIAVDFDAGVTRYRDMFADIEFGFDSYMSIGHSNPLGATLEISLVMDPQLHREVIMQSMMAFNVAFAATLNGNITLDADIPITITMDPDGMVVNWALYTEASFGVTGSATIHKLTNIYCNPVIGVTINAPLEAIINLASDMVIDGLLLNSQFVRLPVPAPEERTLYIGKKGRSMSIPTKGRKLTLVSN